MLRDHMAIQFGRQDEKELPRSFQSLQYLYRIREFSLILIREDAQSLAQVSFVHSN
jgi:hypothetical protein